MERAEDPLLGREGGTSNTEASSSSSRLKWAKLLGAVLLGTVLAYIGFCHRKTVMAWVSSAWGSLKGLGYAAGPVVVFLCWLLTTFSGPVFILEISAGALFQQIAGMPRGALLGMASCGLGVWLGCITAFMLGQSFLKPKVKEIIDSHEVLSTVNEIISEEGWKFAFLMRLNPLIPFELFNYAVSMTDISSFENAIAAIGTLPIVMFEVYGAASAAEIAQSMGTSGAGEHKEGKIKDTLIKLAISGVLIAVVCVYGKRKYDDKAAERNKKVLHITLGEHHRIGNNLRREILSFSDKSDNNEVESGPEAAGQSGT